MRYERKSNSDEERKSKRKIKTKPLVILICILFGFNVLWFIGWLVPDKPRQESEMVASVDGDSISREEWLMAMEKEVGRETLLGLVNEKVMEAAAKKYKIEVSDQEIDLELALIRSVDSQSYTATDEDKLRQQIRSNLILEKVLTKDVVIEEKVITSYYDENESLYHIPTAYRTAVIVLSSMADAEQTISELAGGSSFEVLAKERSVDIGSANLGGDIGYIHASMQAIDQEIVTGAANLKEGTTSGIIKLSDGTYAILRVSDIMKGQSFKLNEVKDHILRELALEQLTQSVSPEAFWKEFDAKWFYGD
ncbi:peptidyl-prolyl cis-trans isomerase [Sporosarcina sp. CAU 1771]